MFRNFSSVPSIASIVSPSGLSIPNPDLWYFDQSSATASTSISTGLGNQTIYLKKKINDNYTIESANGLNVIVVDKGWRGPSLSLTIPLSDPIEYVKGDFGSWASWLTGGSISDSDYTKTKVEQDAVEASFSTQKKKVIVDGKVKTYNIYSGTITHTLLRLEKNILIPNLSIPALGGFGVKPTFEVSMAATVSGEGESIAGINYKDVEINGDATVSLTGSGTFVIGQAPSGLCLLEAGVFLEGQLVFTGLLYKQGGSPNTTSKGRIGAGAYFQLASVAKCETKKYVIVSTDPNEPFGKTYQ